MTNNIIKNINISIGKRCKTVMPVLFQRKMHLPGIYWPRKFALIGFKMGTGNGGSKNAGVMAINLKGKNEKNINII